MRKKTRPVILKIRHYRIVGNPGNCLDEMKTWLHSGKEIKNRADVQSLVNQITNIRKDTSIVVEESGEVNLQSAERRHSSTKQ